MLERDYSRRARAALRRAGFTVYPVETGGTASGFPDLYIGGRGVNTFIELKSRPDILLESIAGVELEGRGQAAFALRFARDSKVALEHVDVFRHTFLLCSCKNGSALFVEDLEGKSLINTWLGAEGALHPASLGAALRAAHVSVLPNSKCKGQPFNNVLRGAASVYEGFTGISLKGSTAPDIARRLENREDAYTAMRLLRQWVLYQLAVDSSEQGFNISPVEDGGIILT